MDNVVRMAERSKALRSGRSPLLWAWVRIPLLTVKILSGYILASKFLQLIKRSEWRSGSVLGP